MKCCINCFSDKYLADIIKQNSKEIGKCDYCASKKVNIIEPKELNYYFQPLFALYEEVEDGFSLAQLLKDDWFLFQDLDNENIINLLENILDIKLNLYKAIKQTQDKIFKWQEFKEELKHQNRYFPLSAPNVDDLKTLLEYVVVSDKIPNFLYRARVNIDTEKIDMKEMGKPPKKLSTAGRANPIGIPYLYTASNPKTAIAEIRPHKGDSVTVARFKVTEDLKLADLRNPRKTISPFMQDEDGLKQIFKDLDCLSHLGEELSKPILPRDAHLEYLSSQYLCEFIKHSGFDGVIYKSSVGDGDNYAIFNDDKLKAINTEVYYIENIEIRNLKIKNY